MKGWTEPTTRRFVNSTTRKSFLSNHQGKEIGGNLQANGEANKRQINVGQTWREEHMLELLVGLSSLRDCD